jgi:acetamidase/formamidase
VNIRSLSLFSLCLAASAPALGQEQYRRFTRTPYYMGPNDPERGKIRGTLRLGETVVIEVPGDTGDTDLKPGVVPDPNVTPPRGSRPGGPFEIEGVKPRDWLAIRIIDIAPGPYGYSNNHGPVRGPFRVLTPVKDGMVHFPPDFVVPMRPMLGVVHLQAAAALPLNIWDTGGNLDFNSIRAGSTVYIRAQRYGGMLTIGDAHAYMSDGELTGTGVEIDVTVTLKVDRVPGFPTGGVVVETADNWYTAGIGATWEEAVKVAWAEMVALVSHLHNTTAEHANLIVGTIGDAVPGYAAGTIFHRGFQRPSYITCQIAIPKSLRRTGKPFQP